MIQGNNNDKINLSRTLMILTCSSLCGLSFSYSTQVTFKEGMSAELIFQLDSSFCHCENNRILNMELQRGSRPPLYRNGHISRGGLTEDGVKKLAVRVICHQPLHSVHILLRNVKRGDAGVYYCHIYENGSYPFPSTTKAFRVKVEFPPGRATCRFPRDYHRSPNGWNQLECVASAGSSTGYLRCYQRGDAAPPWTLLLQTATTLRQTFWMKKTHPIFCCSSVRENGGRCDCDDFVWNPVAHRDNPESVQHPCSPSSTASSGSQHEEIPNSQSGPSSVIYDGEMCRKEDGNASGKTLFSFIGILLVFFLLSFFLQMVFKYRVD